MLLFEGQRKAIDDGSQDLQQLSNAIVVLGLKDEAVEDVVDGLADEGPVHHELAVDAMEDGLQILALPRILAVKQLQQPHHEALIDVLLRALCICVIGDHIAQQEFVHDLRMHRTAMSGICSHA